jgi:hypothetical protein
MCPPILEHQMTILLVRPDHSKRILGVSTSEIHRRAYAGEFTPDQPVDPRILM